MNLPDELKSWTSTANSKTCQAQTHDAGTRTQRAKDTADSRISKKPSSDSLSAPERKPTSPMSLGEQLKTTLIRGADLADV